MRRARASRLPMLAFLGLAWIGAGGSLGRGAEEKANKPENCNAYTVDESKNRITFNNPELYIVIPTKTERDEFRLQGTPAQVFAMKDCDNFDETANLKVYEEPGAAEGSPSTEIVSATPIWVLAEQGDWVQIKGRTKLWSGKGWIKLDDKTVLVKY